MKVKRPNAAKRMVMHPTYRKRVVPAKKGRGSYSRKSKHKE